MSIAAIRALLAGVALAVFVSGFLFTLHGVAPAQERSPTSAFLSAAVGEGLAPDHEEAAVAAAPTACLWIARGYSGEDAADAAKAEGVDRANIIAVVRAARGTVCLSPSPSPLLLRA